MNILKGFMLSCVLVLVTSAAYAALSVSIVDPVGNAIIPPEHIESIIIDPATNVMSITTNVAYTVQVAVDPCTENCNEVAPTITLFTVASPVTVGGSTSVSWTTTDNATSCTPSGNFPGWNGLQNIGTNGTDVVVPMNLVGTFTFSLTCNNGSLASATVSRIIVVNDVVDPNGGACADYVSPLSGYTIPWNSFFAEHFPKPGYANEYASISHYGYYAIEFDTANYVDTGSLMTLESTTTSGKRLGAVSQCPGDFDVAPECQYVWGTSGNIIWSTANYAGACQLEPNTTYYFNITFTDGFDPTKSTCNDAKCITKVRVYNP